MIIDPTISTILIAAFAALPPTIAAVTGLIASRATLRQSRANASVAENANLKAEASNVKADASNEKTDALLRKTEEIHTLTNGNLTTITAELRVANEKIAGLQALLSALTVPKPPEKPPQD